MAQWIALTRKFDYPVPGKRIVISYEADYTAYMPNAHAEAAIAEGAGTPVERPKGARVSKSGAVTYERGRAS